MRISASIVLCIGSIFGIIWCAQTDVCPSYFTRVGEKCYYVSFEKVNWHVAFRKCGALNASLLVFDNERDRNVTTKYLKDKGLPFANKVKDSIWIGINALGNNRKFVLAKNGAPIPYARWCKNQPNDKTEECVAYADYPGCNFGYHDYLCSLLNPFVCETRVQYTRDYLCLRREQFVAATLPVNSNKTTGL